MTCVYEKQARTRARTTGCFAAVQEGSVDAAYAQGSSVERHRSARNFLSARAVALARSDGLCDGMETLDTRVGDRRRRVDVYSDNRYVGAISLAGRT